MMLKTFVSLGLLATLTSCNPTQAEQNLIPVIGLNSMGDSEVKLIPAAVYQQEMTPFMGQLAEEVTDTLEREESLAEMPWELTRVTIGLKLQAEFEVLEDVLEAEVYGETELRFQKFN